MGTGGGTLVGARAVDGRDEERRLNGWWHAFCTEGARKMMGGCGKSCANDDDSIKRMAELRP